MAVEEKENKQNEGKGFAGLSSLVSNVDTTPPRADEKEAIDSATPTGRSVPQPVQPSQPHQESVQPSSGSSGGKWILATVVAFLGIFFLITLADRVRPSSPPASPSEDLHSQTPPKFNEYPSEIFTGPRAAVKLVSEFDNNFRTRIKKTQSQPINFAGEYVLTTWGCGTSCSMGGAVSARTGKVVELPGSVCCWQGEGENVIFKKNSRLLVIAGLINEKGENGTHFYELKNDLFLHVKTIKKSTELTPEYSSATEPVVAKKPPESHTPDLSPVQPQAQKKPVEEQPPVGSGLILSATQIRYCLAEDIRTDGSKSALNNYSDGDVDRFNAIVADYNSRCANFRYHRGALESARQDVEPYRSRLQAEGKSRFAHSPSTGALSAPALSPPTSDATVQAIQHKLNELGYEAGTADGLIGSGTRLAIIAFQQGRGLAATGVADQALLLQLQRAPALTTTSPAEIRLASTSVQLSSAEAASLEAACSTDKYVNGPAAYRACVERQKAALAAGVRRPNLSALSSAEQQSIEASCSTDKYVNGPAAYNQCLARQLAAMSGQGSRRPDLSRLSNSERQSIEAVCSTDKYVNGPAAYNRCLNTQLSALDQHGSGPDLSGLSTADRRSIESVCSTDKYLNGPAAYNRCLSQQLASLR